MSKKALITSELKDELLMGGGVQLEMSLGEENKPPRFDIIAYTGGPFRPDSPRLDAPLVIELAGVKSADRIAAVIDHDDRLIVGQTDSVKVGRKDIRMSGIVTGDITADEEANPSAKVVKHAARGFVWPVSLGASISKLDYIQPGASTTVNGRRFDGPLYIARRIELNHISFLSVPADKAAMARIAASRRKESDMNFHEWLKGLGFDDPSTLSESQRTSLQAKYDEEQKLAASTPKPQATPATETPAKPKRNNNDLAAIKANKKRQDEINAMAVRYAREYPDAIDAIEARCAEAIEDENWTSADFENLMLRETTRHERIDNRPRGRRESEVEAQPIMEVALCRLGGTTEKTLLASYGEKTVEESRRRFRKGLSIREFLEMASAANGFRGNFRSETEDILAHAFPDRRSIQARHNLAASGPSTYDVSDILTNVVNRFVVDHFMSVDQAAMRMISAVRPVNDFRQIESYSLTGDMTFERVAPGGKIKHGTLGNEKYTNRADTFAKMFTIDRRDLINDDLGAFAQIGRRLGRGGILSLLDVFWTAFLDNANFFKTANKNYMSGAATNLQDSSLTAAKTLLRKQVDPDRRSLGALPKILLGCPELEGIAKGLLNSQLLIMAGTAAGVTTQPNANIHAGTLELAIAPELSNTTYDGASAKSWYLLADPTDIPVIETCFLNGVDRPTVENAQADFDQLGVKMRAFFDFGVEKQEFRGGVKSKGEA